MKRLSDSHKSEYIDGFGQVYIRDSSRPKKTSKRLKPKSMRPSRKRIEDAIRTKTNL